MIDPTNKNSVIIHEDVDPDLFYRSLFEYNPDLAYYSDTHGIIAKPNEGFCKTLGYRQEEIVQHSLERFIPQSEIPKYRKAFAKTLAGEIQHFNTLFLPKTGNPRIIFLSMLPAKVAGKVIGVFGVAKDITKRQLIEQSLQDSELKFRSIVEGAFIGVYIFTENGQVSYGNRQFYKLLGLENTEEVNFWDCIHPEDLPAQKAALDRLMNGKDGVDHSFRLLRKDGSIIFVEAHSKKVYLQNDQLTIIGVLRDISERKRAEELTHYLAYYDTLTALPNRKLFQKKLEQVINVSKTSKQKFAVLYLDLDRFKYINDTLGHSIGDKLIKQTAERIKLHLGEEALLARWGGDEFFILLPHILNAEQVADLAETINEAVREPYLIDKYNLILTTSIGISIFPDNGEDAETLSKHADSALYKAKEKGKNTYTIHSASMDLESYRIFTLEADLRQAIEQNQLELYYQPKVCADTYQIVGAEALIRWNHPEWGMISPDDFIPLAEETGVITDIDKWITHKASLQNKAWQDVGLQKIPVSINLSAQRFLEKDLISHIRTILADANLDPEFLEIEILESTMLENETVVLSVLAELKRIGVRVSIDDFGTGYSSLSYLNHFKGWFDTLKIDRSFISDLTCADSKDSNFITKTIIELSRHLHVDTVAEGVETQEQLDILMEYKCRTIQGYLFSKPVRADAFADLLKRGKIEPPGDHHPDETVLVEDRRKFFRIELDFPLSAAMTMTRIHGRNVKLENTEVLIENIGLGGLRFLSDLRLAIHRDIILEFETEILGHTIKLSGAVVWMKEVKPGIYQYGFEFSIGESDRAALTSLLNKFAIQLAKPPLIPNCRFVTTNRYHFFKEKNRK
ncbi:EAL domain-containing protein [Bacillus benzoevorans]|uniref:Diguanylate cyclase (GGDEF)-like protein/PAS domain S-box-containing protein n=1 Tax=Bacillus benzoevorans TaxID=1456 RepID=A0A7X0LXH0_9BACI|nr:EAL domain-containing protein [Bacillus benzoevorans]MBB6447610.1 diguanylate cyclase (GGDEF)-like protein/PAS domain S-box-containing protein [Bacillus benzoevorans]